MSTTGIDAFDTTLQKTHLWLKELMAEMGWDSLQRAYTGLRAALHALRNRLTLEEAMHLGAQLPLILRGAYFEGWDYRRNPTRERRKEDFLARVAEELVWIPDIDPERLTRAVFRVISRRVTSGEIADLRQILPHAIRSLWPESGGVADRALTAGSSKKSGAKRRAKARKAKREIRTVLARARAGGARAQDLPVLVSRRNLHKARRRPPPAPEGA